MTDKHKQRKISPARLHFQRVAAAQQAGDVPQGRPQTGDQYDLMAAALWEARRMLKDIQSVAAKIERKRELLPQFDAYVDGVLTAGNGAQDDVLMTVMVWHLDIGALARGLEIAEYALRHGLDTPDQYQRGTAALVAEQVAEEALAQLAEEDAQAVALEELLSRAIRLTGAADMHDQIRAKLLKALGYAQQAAGAPREALTTLREALRYNDRVGVKKDIEKLEREIAKQDNPSASKDGNSSQEGEGTEDPPAAAQAGASEEEKAGGQA